MVSSVTVVKSSRPGTVRSSDDHSSVDPIAARSVSLGAADVSKPPVRTTWIYLLRHGATAANRAVPYRIQGRGSDLDLDELGRCQALRAAEVLQTIALEAVYSSPLRRARQTAAEIARLHRLEVRVVPELVEADVGAWEGLTWEEVEQRDPDHFAFFLANPGTVPYLGGESFQDVQARVLPALNALATLHPGGRIAVVAHNVVNRAYLAALLNLPISQARELPQANGGINLIRHDGHPPGRIVTLNAALHLEGLE